jgi:EAL domain-containing protein (putative c-di-GMP-specific phosphodiesterase class I)
LLIKKYALKHEIFFEDYRNKFPELFMWSWKYIEKNLDNYEKYFFDSISSKLWIYLKYEKIVDTNWKIIFREWLLRTSDKLDLNAPTPLSHIDLLNIYNDFWRSLEVYYHVLNRLFSDIKTKKIEWVVSINVEVSDLMDSRFLHMFRKMKERWWIDILKWSIILEILENQKVPLDNDKFYKTLKELNEEWFKIAIDDIIQSKCPLPEALKILDNNNRIKIAKIDWKTIQTLFNAYESVWDIMDSTLDLFKMKLNEIMKKWVRVVWEWIENKKILLFAKLKLWIQYFQWYFVQDATHDEIKNTI